ncbi:MAG: hypothetical protein ABSB88_23695 [Bryobacteraceae bacterium]|jgi:hypothetical protein
MKLVHTKLARSIWLFDLRDLNPKGEDLLGDLVSWVKDTYNFAVAPDPDNPVPNPPTPTSPIPQTAPVQAPGGLVFQRGNFQTQGEFFVSITALTLYDDGIVVDTTSSTDDADRFAGHLLRSAVEAFKVAFEPAVIRRKLYLSELVVRSEMSLESLHPALATFATRLPSSVAGGQTLPFGVGAVSFWSEPNDAGQHRVFSVERQLGRAFSENRFYSQAPLQTHVHFGLLQELESLVLAR